MKWFKHYSDANSNLKFQAVIAEHGMVGYGLFWVCDELVAQQGDGFLIKSDKRWKNSLAYRTRMSLEEIEKILVFFTEINLISKEAFDQGDLHIPKLGEYGDEYSSRKKGVSGEYRDNVVLDKKRIDKNRLEDTPHAHQNYLNSIPLEDLKEFVERFDATARQVKSKGEDLSLYCTSKGRVYKNYKSFLLNALKKDFKERPPKKEASPPQVEEEATPEQRQEMARIRKEISAKFSLRP